MDRSSLVQIEIDDPRFDDRSAIQGVHLDDSSHPMHIEYPGTLEWNRPTTEPGPRTTSHKGNNGICEYFPHLDHFFLIFKKKYSRSDTPVERQPIAIVEPTFIFIGEDP